MKVCLVSPPTVVEFEATRTSRSRSVRLLADQPPLGILSLAAILEQRGIALQIFDLNRLFCDLVRAETPADFFATAAAELRAIDAVVFGFSTICNTYPLSVRLAAEVKRAHPDAVVVFGGPQATSVDSGTLETFPFVDVVVRGEAEEIFPCVLDCLGDPRRMAGVAGISFRNSGKAVRTPDAPVLRDLDRLPMPAYHLWPGLAEAPAIPLEIGRGCPFACTFCSTSGFFRRRYRLKTPEVVIRQMKSLQATYGVGAFTLIHDAFTADRSRALKFCEALIDSGQQFRWACSARSDCLDDELLSVMAGAGCTDVFLGIESGAPAIQRSIGKNLDLDRAKHAISSADAHKVRATVSLITGFPEETQTELRGTLDFLMDVVRFDSVRPQFHLLAPTAGTVLHSRYRGRLRWDGIFSDMALQAWRQNPAERALVQQHPDLFPDFYGVPAALDRRYSREVRDFVVYGLARMRWLMIALHQQAGGIMEVFESWLARRRERRPDAEADSEYYASAEFRRDFISFVEARYLAPEPAGKIAVAALVEYENGLDRCERRPLSGEELSEPPIEPESIPALAAGVALIELSADYNEVLGCLRTRKPVDGSARRRVVLADRELPDGSIEVIQLTPLSAALLRLCDGRRTAAEIATAFPSFAGGLDELPAGPACLFALRELQRQRLLSIARPGCGAE